MGFLDGLFGLTSNIFSTNKAVQSQRETNAANRQLVQDQNAFNELMWNKNNQYNSLAEQKKRALQAGFNPAILSGQNSVSATPVVQQGIAHQQSNAQTYMAGGQQALNALSLFYDADVKKQQG